MGLQQHWHRRRDRLITFPWLVAWHPTPVRAIWRHRQREPHVWWWR